MTTTRELHMTVHAPQSDRPLAVLSDARGGAGLVLRLHAVGDSYFGLVSARAQLVERVRLGLVPMLALEGARGEVLCGDARVTLHGRADADPSWAHLGREDPFGAEGSLVIEVKPLALAAERHDDEPRGACPRT